SRAQVPGGGRWPAGCRQGRPTRGPRVRAPASPLNGTFLRGAGRHIRAPHARGRNVMRRSGRRRLLWAAAVALLLTGVLTRHPGVIIAQTATPKYGGTFVYSLGGEPAHLNPAITLSVLENQVGAAIFDVLVELNQELVPVPSLAESWKISPDGLRYEFTLVDTRWHDGKPVTSEDVKFTFEEALLKAHPRCAAQRDRIKSIETPNPRTGVF